MGSGLRRFSVTRRSRENLLRRLRRRHVDSDPLYRDASATPAGGAASNPYATGREAA